MSQQTIPRQTIQLTQADLKDENLGQINNLFASLQNQINALSGAMGKTVLPQGVDVAGSTVSNVGEPATPTDAISKAHAEKNYSAQAIAPQLESGSSVGLKTYRALNSKSQQEQYSTFLNAVMNTAPTCNSSTISAAAPSGGTVAVTVSAGQHLYVDNSKITPYAQRTDTLTLPTSYSISSIARSGGIVTVVTSSATGYTVGEAFAVNNVTDSTYDGSFLVKTVAGTTITYAQAGPDSTSSGGKLSTGSVRYYYLRGNSQALAISGAYPADTQQNRLAVNVDNSVLIAVAVLNGAGLDLTQSSAGATPPVVTGNSRLLTRL